MHLTVQTLRSIIRENVGQRVIATYHTSSEPLVQLQPTAMWFAPTLVLARAYHSFVRADVGSAHTYKVSLHGTIMSRTDIIAACKINGIDHSDMEADLTGGPRDVPGLLQEHSATVLLALCDGFYMNDYDPRDSSRDVESIIVFNAARSATLGAEVTKKQFDESW